MRYGYREKVNYLFSAKYYEPKYSYTFLLALLYDHNPRIAKAITTPARSGFDIIKKAPTIRKINASTIHPPISWSIICQIIKRIILPIIKRTSTIFPPKPKYLYQHQNLVLS